VYKAASEGIMNLADKFFEMERAQALQVCTAHVCQPPGLGVVLAAGQQQRCPSTYGSNPQKPLPTACRARLFLGSSGQSDVARSALLCVVTASWLWCVAVCHLALPAMLLCQRAGH
jgi:hypothetical protein